MIDDNFKYELEFEEKLLDLIKFNYGSSNQQIYFILRYMIIKKESSFDKIDCNDFIDFLLEQNNLPRMLIYKLKTISIYSNSCQSISNICAGWFFDLQKLSVIDNSKNDILYIENTYKDILNKTIKYITKYKKTNYYNDLLLFSLLKELNIRFNVDLNNFGKIDNLSYPDNFKFNDYLENILLRKIELHQNEDKNKQSIITEKQLENYIKKHLDKIEDGLKFVSVQYPIENAFIDILAKDKEDNIVIIELKIKDDERVIWQSIYYPLQFKKEHSFLNIRFFVISPSYPNWILKPLNTLENIEKFQYKLVVENNEITDILITKI